MKKILDEFYYGNITPGDIPIPKNSSYAATMNSVVEYEEKLTALLGDEGKVILKQHDDANAELLSISSCEMWKMGFRLGLLMGMEIIKESVDII